MIRMDAWHVEVLLSARARGGCAEGQDSTRQRQGSLSAPFVTPDCRRGMLGRLFAGQNAKRSGANGTTKRRRASTPEMGRSPRGMRRYRERRGTDRDDRAADTPNRGRITLLATRKREVGKPSLLARAEIRRGGDGDREGGLGLH